MLYIQKKQEPASLTRYRKQKFAHFDGYPDKDDVRSFYQATDPEGMKKEYAGIVVWYLQKKLNKTR